MIEADSPDATQASPLAPAAQNIRPIGATDGKHHGAVVTLDLVRRPFKPARFCLARQLGGAESHFHTSPIFEHCHWFRPRTTFVPRYARFGGHFEPFLFQNGGTWVGEGRQGADTLHFGENGMGRHHQRA
ncbi:hypothetical protein FHS91_003932 [Sphingobium xanthum]